MKKLALFFCAFFIFFQLLATEKQKPNVLLIITDDQGYGDLGITGNPHITTPTIDQLAKESIRFNNFLVSPVCAPTRSSLMTGRYSLRTGIRDTYNGGATMASSEVTIAEMLKNAGYSTAIFGKWHLGDNYPCRPNDQGFDESLIHLSGGMGQVGDITTYFKGNKSYFNPVLWHNGKQKQYDGYCTDIFANNAIEFIEENKDKPFFCYLAFNAPHTPLQLPEKYYQMYQNIDPSSGFEDMDIPMPKMSKRNKEDARKVYGMVTNIDDNLRKLFSKLNSLKIEDNTIIIFMTDNGPQQYRFVAGMRGKKGSVYNGGVKVPFYLKYPGKFKGNKDINQTTAHIDILPTLAELCDAKLPSAKIDGRSMVNLITKNKASWPQRPLFFYWNRKYPELYNNIAIHEGNLKLVGRTNYNAKITDFELYNLSDDPYEQNNIITKNTEHGLKLKAELDSIYKELISSKNIKSPPLVIIGTENENPIILNRNDADGDRGIWAQEEIFGKWHAEIIEGNYNVSFKFIKPIETGGKLYLQTGEIINQTKYNGSKTDLIKMSNIQLPEMKCEIIPFYEIEGKRIFPFWIEFHKKQD